MARSLPAALLLAGAAMLAGCAAPPPPQTAATCPCPPPPLPPPAPAMMAAPPPVALVVPPPSPLVHVVRRHRPVHVAHAIVHARPHRAYVVRTTTYRTVWSPSCGGEHPCTVEHVSVPIQ